VTQSTLTVPVMSCEACRTTIAGALEALPGVVAVSVDLDRKLVLVEHDAHLTPPDRLLATAVEDQGYEVAVRAVP
jgi:copper chaperone CopZ